MATDIHVSHGCLNSPLTCLYPQGKPLDIPGCHLKCFMCELATFSITLQDEGHSFCSSLTTNLTAMPGTGPWREPCGNVLFRDEIPLTAASCWQLSLPANGTRYFKCPFYSFVCSCLFSFSLNESVWMCYLENRALALVPITPKGHPSLGLAEWHLWSSLSLPANGRW